MLIVPFDVEASYAAGKYGGTSHLDRMKEALAFLRSHDLFKNRPKSFFWMVHFWQMSSWAMNSSGVFPQDGLDVIHDMSLGRFEWYHANYNEYQSMRQQGKQCFDDVPLALQQWEDWRCTVVAPYFHNQAISVVSPSYREWANRPNKIHFRWEYRRYFSDYGGDPNIRQKAKELQHLPGYVIGRQTLPQIYQQELVGSQFVLVVRGDTPTSSHFSDAVAAGCIPVVVSNGFFQYGAPFNRILNLHEVIPTIDEDEWVSSPTKATEEFLSRIADKKQEIFERFDAVRHSLLWEPSEESQRTQNAATAVLTQWKIDCGP
jgi:hypothetical protein